MCLNDRKQRVKAHFCGTLQSKVELENDSNKLHNESITNNRNLISLRLCLSQCIL